MSDVPPASRTLVGRDVELRELRARLGVAHVVLSGDAGVGKTRLLLALRDAAEADGWRVAAGHCLDFGDSALPYLPFTEVLGRLAADVPEVVETVTAAYPSLTRLLPGRRTRESSAPSTSGSAGGESLDRGDLFAAVHALFEAVADAAPLLVVIEDCHWADRSTRELITFLFSRPFEGSVTVIASYRADDLHRRHPLRRQVAEWSRLTAVERLALAPLADDDVRSLVSELAAELAAPVDDAALARIVRRAEGNAFFVEELVGAAGRADDVPEDLSDLLLVRLDRLDDGARQVVRIASAAGRQVSHDLLAAVSGLPSAELETGVREAVEMNLLVPGHGAYAFRHALLGEAVYDDLLPGERTRLHQRYVECLVARPELGAAAELARHARLALDLDRALTASIQAGDEAMGVGGPDEAAQHYEQALELVADPTREAASGVDVPALAARAGAALRNAGRLERAADLLADQVSRLSDQVPAASRARMLSGLAETLYLMETDQDPVAMARKASALVGDPGPLRAGLLATQARILAGYGHLDEAQGVGLDALALAERLGLGELASDVVTTLSNLKQPGPKEELRSALRAALDRAQSAGALPAELRSRYFLGRSHQDWGELAEAESWFRSGMEVGVAAGLPYAPYAFECRWQLAWITYARGDWEETVRLTGTADEPAPPVQAAMLLSVRLVVDAARGLPVADRAVALRPIWELEGSIVIDAAAAELATADSAESALATYREASALMGRIWFEQFAARVRLAAVTLGTVAEHLVHRTVAERRWCAQQADELRADGRAVVDFNAEPGRFWGPEGRAWAQRLEAEALRVRWLAGVGPDPGTDDPDDPARPERLVDVWQEVESRFAEFGHVYELASVRVTLGAILRATGDPAAAGEVEQQARATATRLGARPLLDRLDARSAPPAAARGATSEALTPREAEILALVAEGRSNGEIGKHLFIATKTVSVHVSNILAKLGAAGRTEAAAIGRRRGLLG